YMPQAVTPIQGHWQSICRRQVSMKTLALKPGMRLKSAVSDVQVMVVKSNPGQVVNLCCGEVPMLEANEEASGEHAEADLQVKTLMGKRYVNPDQTVEL